MGLSIAGVEIGAGQPTRFVCELGNAHNQSLARAHRLIDAAKEAGADFAKFQCYLPAEIGALRGGMDAPAPSPWGDDGTTMAQLYERAKTPFDWFPELVNHCEAINLPWFSSVFGAESLALLESLNVPALKVARLDNKNPALFEIVEAAGRRGIPIVVSERLFGESGYQGRRISAEVIRLYCPPLYPQERFDFFAEDFTGVSCHCYEVEPRFDGFSYHGTSIEPPIVAATLGAKLIECHFQLDNELSELEKNVSLTASQFEHMVNRVRAVEEMLA